MSPSLDPGGPAPDALHELRDAMRRFAAERAWEPFHTPKNLAMALAGEAGEVIEHFQWLTAEQSLALPPAPPTPNTLMMVPCDSSLSMISNIRTSSEKNR